MAPGSEQIAIKTHFNDRLIEQTIDIAGVVHRRVLHIGEEQIRQALIAMGWTPPRGQTRPGDKCRSCGQDAWAVENGGTCGKGGCPHGGDL